MCGINGIIDFYSAPEGAERIITRMNDALLHRGPDGEGVYTSPGKNAILGSRRLSIVDVQGGAMPISYVHEGHEYAIVSNGEFFNFRAVRGELAKKYQFKTQSDTEVALCAYIEWGEECVEHLHGQFAFLVYDSARKRVFFARDRVGIKPLFYCELDTTLIVSSEPKGILSHPDVRREPDREAITDYFLGVLTLSKSEPLDRSLFKGVHSLLPGERAWFDRAGLHKEKYYRVPFGASDLPQAELAAALRKEVTRAVHEQIPAEVPYGIALSGGVDSSIVTAIAAHEAHAPVAAATIRYEAQENPDYDHAALMAKREEVRLDAPVLTPERMMRDVDAVVLALDRPYDSPRELGLFGLYRTLQEAGCKVALIGEGSDEFNLGYYYRMPGYTLEGEESAEQFRALLQTRAGSVTRYFNPAFSDATLVEKLLNFNVDTYYNVPTLEKPIERAQHYYIKKLLKIRLDMHDRCAMAHSIEARVPFCDEGVIETSLSVPPAYNLAGGAEKAVLRGAFRDMLPAEIVERRKSPVPESTNVRLYRMIIEAFDAAFKDADDRVWDILSREYAKELRAKAETEVSAIEQGGQRSLGDGAQLTKPQDFRIRHLFIVLTFMRWHQLHFVEEVFS